MVGLHTDDLYAFSAQHMAPSGLRQNNERAVLTAIALTDGASAAEVARQTGLGAQSVSRILADLEASGLVVKGQRLKGRRGQPATPLLINPDGAFCIGCEVGWRHVEVLVQNLHGQILGRHRRDYPSPDRTTIVKEIGSLVTLLSGLIPVGRRDKIVGIGLAMPSGFDKSLPVSAWTDKDAQSWQGFDIVKELTAATALPVFLYNDGTAACWGDLASRSPPRPQNFAYLMIGTFIGSGLTIDGRLLEGKTGGFSNLGAMLLTGKNGDVTHLHAIASLYALNELLAMRNVRGPLENPSSADWNSFEPELSAWIKDAGWAVAKALANTVAVVDIDTVIIEGVFPKEIRDRFVDEVKTQMDEIPVFTARPIIEVGVAGPSAAAIGAASRPMYLRLFSRATPDLVDLGTYL